MQQLLLLLHVILAIFIIVLVLIQHGKGADIGAAFGSGASQTVFGSQGSGSFLLKITCLLAGLFFVTTISLSYLGSQQVKSGGETLSIPAPPPHFPISTPNSSVVPDVNVSNTPHQSQVPSQSENVATKKSLPVSQH